MKHVDPAVDYAYEVYPSSETVEAKPKPFIIDLLPEDFAAFGSEEGNLSPNATAPKNQLVPPVRTAKKSSPKRMLDLLSHSRSDIEAARHACVLRSEKRQSVARESRMVYLFELKRKSYLDAARIVQVRNRRAEAHRLTSEASRVRQEQGVQRAKEFRRQTIAKVQKNLVRVEEVVFTTETKNMEKQILLKKRMNSVEQHLEQKREQRERIAKVKNDSMRAAAERRLLMTNEKVEKHTQRVQQHEEKIKRIQELKKTELKSKHQQSEKWERKIQQHQRESKAEAAALLARTEKKFRQSELILKERQEQIRKKIKLQEQKLSEAKERRDREVELNFSYKDIMSSYDTGEEELLSQKLSAALEASHKQNKSFSDTYQRNSTMSQRDLLKSKLKNSVGRLASLSTSGVPVQSRPLLSEISSANLTATDHEYIRYFNALESITKLVIVSRKTRHVAVVKQAADALVSLFSAEGEGIHNATYFVRSGLLTQIVVAAHEEANTMRKNSLTTTLSSLLSCIASCVEVLYSAAETNSKVVSVRDLLLNELEKLALDRIYFVVLKMCLAPKDLELTYAALRIIYVILSINSKKKGDAKDLWHYCLAVSLFALLQNIVAAGAGNPEASRNSISVQNFTCSQLVLIFCALRQLNILARWRLGEFQEMLHDSTSHPSGAASTESELLADVSVQITRMELFHFLNQFFEYVHAHITDLEMIETNEVAGVQGKDKDNSFSAAERFGLTLSYFPDLPVAKNVEANRYLYVAGGKHYHLRAALHECILLIGYLCLDDRAVQEILSWGKGKTLLEKILFLLPAHYFTNARHILFPTLLNIVDNNPRNTAIVCNVVEIKLLHQFLEEETRHLSKKARSYAENRSIVIKAYRASLECGEDREEADQSLVDTEEKNEERMLDQGIVIEVQDKIDRNAAVADYLASGDEKDKLMKSFKASTSDFSEFFKLEKRVPVAFWPLLLAQLSECIKDR